VIAIDWRGELPGSAYGEAERRVNAGRLAGVQLAIPGVPPARIGDPRAVSMAVDGPVFTPPGGFAQASEIGDRVLVDLVTKRANAEGLRVLELFAGSGNFTVSLARVAEHVTAVEIDAPSSNAARENVAARGLKNVKTVTADADSYAIPKETDVVVLDPPRAGARGAVAAINARRLKRVVYVSCDPSTLARDLKTLTNYSVVSLDAVDIFPDTSHIESVVVLERKK
jgi:23S rRNA (uracil1939-C5)-methyltransferase